MRLVFIVNDPRELEPTQTTTMLVHAAVRKGDTVFVVGVGDLTMNPAGQVQVEGYQLTGGETETVEEALQVLKQAPLRSVVVEPEDAILMRTNPARDPRWVSHQHALSVCTLAKKSGVLVVNDPSGLYLASSKAYLMRLPRMYRPETLVSQSSRDIEAFVLSQETGAVLKPVWGTRGKDVYVFESGSALNLRTVIDTLHQQGPIVAQEYLPDAVEGDVRVVVCGGEILMEKGESAAVRRVPAAGDLRSNIHAGGRAVPVVLTEDQRERARDVARTLKRDGIFYAGLDFVGTRLLEVNVFSTGGLHHATEFYGVDFSTALLDKLTSASRPD